MGINASAIALFFRLMILKRGYSHDRQTFDQSSHFQRDRVINFILDANQNQSRNQPGLAHIRHLQK
ncbi:hypothetical protein OGM63_15655 [Plectonema radiosum NIES-515]|uniref:Uncharacterized protein n=1 Tax=Plectonema radiosum NIES-515 TaxID=2986073 RepID=A0ABT3B0P2_9CYAN|nr:hypothetical protein [Plectonema radiosum]MCV3214931.1 hypothetical protein [Plectonema radiosum NIES-515]